MKKVFALLMLLMAVVALGACTEQPADDPDVVIEEPIAADDTMTDTMMSDTAMSDTTMTDTSMTDTSMTDTSMTDNDGM